MPIKIHSGPVEGDEKRSSRRKMDRGGGEEELRPLISPTAHSG